MSALNVSRMRVRYRVPAADPNVRKRLDAVLDRVLGDALEPALVLRGVPVSEEICVRVVRAPARLRLDDGERSAAASAGSTCTSSQPRQTRPTTSTSHLI